jgi:hypothetical protein
MTHKEKKAEIYQTINSLQRTLNKEIFKIQNDLKKIKGFLNSNLQYINDISNTSITKKQKEGNNE